jgi:ribose transport system substrate-binding protein
MKKYRFFSLGVALALLLTACASSGNDEASTESAAPFEAVLKGGIPGALLPEELQLWKYDFTTGAYTVDEGDASSYALNLNKPGKTFTLAHMDGWATNPFAIPIRKSIEKNARDLGLKLIYCDAEFKPEKAISCLLEIGKAAQPQP